MSLAPSPRNCHPLHGLRSPKQVRHDARLADTGVGEGLVERSPGDAEWLDGAFSAGDLMMVTVLRRASGSGLLEKHPNLCAYIARGEARPAYQRAFADQLKVFTKLND